MDLNLSGGVAIVTGASRGIGRAIAQTLAAEGMKITAAARSKDQLDDLAKSHQDRLPRPGRRSASARARAAAVVDATVEKFGEIDLLVNNAGATKRGDFFELTDADWDDGFALKFFGAMRLSRAAWKHLRPATAPSSTSSASAAGPAAPTSRSAAASTPPAVCSRKRWPIAASKTACASTPSTRAHQDRAARRPRSRASPTNTHRRCREAEAQLAKATRRLAIRRAGAKSRRRSRFSRRRGAASVTARCSTSTVARRGRSRSGRA